MKIVLLSNPRSGRGRGERAADRLSAALAGDFDVRRVRVGDGGDLASEVRGAVGLLVAGGDGSVLRAASAAMAADVPIYHVPCGNENLFARQFGMAAEPEAVRRALQRRDVQRVDVGMVASAGREAEPFLIMCSFGPDASVIHRLAAVRSKAVGHLAYAGPVMGELRRPRFPRATVRLDGRTVVEARSGILVVANSRQYALRIDPAFRASVSDGLLDVVFLPCGGRLGALAWGLRCRARRHGGREGAVYAQGREVEVETIGEPPLYQLDGEACATGAAGPLRFSLRPGALPVLIP